MTENWEIPSYSLRKMFLPKKNIPIKYSKRTKILPELTKLVPRTPIRKFRISKHPWTTYTFSTNPKSYSLNVKHNQAAKQTNREKINHVNIIKIPLTRFTFRVLINKMGFLFGSIPHQNSERTIIILQLIGWKSAMVKSKRMLLQH